MGESRPLLFWANLRGGIGTKHLFPTNGGIKVRELTQPKLNSNFNPNPDPDPDPSAAQTGQNRPETRLRRFDIERDKL